MRAAVIENGKVVNVILVDSEEVAQQFNAIICEDEVAIGWAWDGETFSPPPLEPTPPQPPVVATPHIFASAGITIVGGAVISVELAAQLASAYYEDGWMQVFFAEVPGFPYLVFVQTDVPVKIEQFKDLGSFELVFSDPVTGDPIEPGRIDLQILKVR